MYIHEENILKLKIHNKLLHSNKKFWIAKLSWALQNFICNIIIIIIIIVIMKL